MKYSININQKELSKTNLDMLECAILDYLIVYCNSLNPKIQKNRVKDESLKIWSWIDYKSLLKDMPLLRTNSISVLSKKIQKIKNAGYILKLRSSNQKLYIRLTEKVDELFFEQNISEAVSVEKQVLNAKAVSVEKRIDNNTNIDNNTKKISSKQVASTTEKFIWADYLKEMLSDSREHIKFIARFFKYRDLTYPTKKAAIEAISRFSRIASKLVKTYSEEDLQWAAKYCKNAYPNIQWTPETMLKALTSGKRNSDGLIEAASFGRTKIKQENKQKSTKYDNIGSSI
ncbi:MAG: hypothetical protein WC438_05455 [Candidatus Pacearchaeota archaeon]